MVNNYITNNIFAVFYILLQKIFDKVLVVGKYAVLIKQDVKNMFQNIFIISYI